MSDVTEVLNVINDYCLCLDDPNTDRREAFLDLWEPDSEWQQADQGTLKGADAIARNYEHYKEMVPPGQIGYGVKHLTMNSTVSVDGNTATAESDFIITKFAEGQWCVWLSGRYSDVLRKTDRWRFFRRVIEFMPYDYPSYQAHMAPVREYLSNPENCE